MKRFSKRRFWVILILLMSIGAGVFLCLNARTPQGGVVFLPLPIPEHPPARWRLMADRGLAWLRFQLFGPAKPIILQASVIDFSKPPTPSAPLLADLPSLALHGSATNGVQAWILSDVEMAALRRHLEQTPGAEVVSNPRIQTASGVQADFWVGETIAIDGTNYDVGLTWTCKPRPRRGGNELTSVFTYTQAMTNQAGTVAGGQVTNVISIQTHLAVATRIQMPAGGGAFLLISGGSPAPGKTTGVLISCK